MYSQSIEEVSSKTGADIKHGLTSREAEKRLGTFGSNELPHAKKETVLHKFLMQLKDFMIYTLLVAAGISFAVSYMNGEPDYIQPLIILLIIIMNGIIGVIQEVRAEHSINALKKMCAPEAVVLRNGKYEKIPGKNIVPGDIILLQTGSFIPADARILECSNLTVDEASLTGESVPVSKGIHTLPDKTILSDRTNMVFSGCSVTYGHGKGIVTATGIHTELGHMAGMLLNETIPETPLQKKLAATGKTLSVTALIICVIIFVAGILKGWNPSDMFMTSVSLAVAAIPEGLPAIVTIMLARGVMDMSRKNAVIRRLPAVETLGSTQVICTDKTGTLTLGKMKLISLSTYDGDIRLNTKPADRLLTFFSLCNNSEDGISGEPTENALYLAAKEAFDVDKIKLEHQRLDERAFTSERKMMSTLNKWKGENILICKGAPDILIEKCSYIETSDGIKDMTAAIKRSILIKIDTLAKDGLRVIAAAYKMNKAGKIKNEDNLIYAGLAALMDPPRKEAYDAVNLCKQAGIKTVMITGDHLLLASRIARELKISDDNSLAITGSALDEMDDAALDKSLDRIRVFARVSPAHKLRIVKAYRRKNMIVAMTGDGVNDAAALKAADIGVAMGITGTDVTKNAADLILEDDNFATITSAIKHGRIIYDNIKKAVHFLVSCNIGEILTIFLAIIMGLGSPLSAVQLLWINLVTDSFPALSLGVEPGDEYIMKRKPLHSDKSIFSGGLGLKTALEGMMIGSLALVAYAIGLRQDAITAGTMCFAVLGLSQLSHAFNSRSEHSILGSRFFSNKMMLLSAIVCIILQTITITVPVLRDIFGTTMLNMYNWIIVISLSLLPVFIIELQKKVDVSSRKI